jgi:hypothetical protein
MMTSSDQTGKLLKKKNVTRNKDPPEGKTTAIVAVMRGRPKNSHNRQRSNKHYKRKLVRVLLDSGSDGDLIFVDKDKPMLLPTAKRLVPQSWNTLSGRFQTTEKAEIELTSLSTPIAKGTSGHLISLSIIRLIGHSMTLF